MNDLFSKKVETSKNRRDGTEMYEKQLTVSVDITGVKDVCDGVSESKRNMWKCGGMQNLEGGHV